MHTLFPFSGQRMVQEITREEIDAFNMERFKFAESTLPPGKAVSARPFEAVRDASLRLLEAAMGERRENALPKIDEAVLRRYTAGDVDGSIW